MRSLCSQVGLPGLLVVVGSFRLQLDFLLVGGWGSVLVTRLLAKPL